MKRILTILSLLVSTGIFAQHTQINRTNGTNTVNDPYFKADHYLGIPRGAAPTLNGGLDTSGLLFFNTVDLSLYVYQGNGVWSKVGSGASINIGNSDLTLTSNRTLSGAGKTFTISGHNGIRFTASSTYTGSLTYNTTFNSQQRYSNLRQAFLDGLDPNYVNYRQVGADTVKAGIFDSSNSWYHYVYVDSVGARISQDSVSTFPQNIAWRNDLGYIQQSPSSLFAPNTRDNYCASGCTVTWLQNYDYVVAPSVYYINQKRYESPATYITLDPSDITDPRIDIFYLDTLNTAGAITGTPSTPPVSPTVNSASQLYLALANVAAGSTDPGTTTIVIYKEDAGPSAEWTTTSNSGNIVKNSTNTPYAGSVDIEGTNVATSNSITFTVGSSPDFSTVNSLNFQIKSKAGWTNTRKMQLQWFNGTTPVGNMIPFGQSSYGFASNSTGTYQNITVPLSDFGDITGATVLRMLRSGGGTIGFYIDNVLLTTSEGSVSTGITILGSAPISVITAGSISTVSHNNSGVAAGTYGDATHVPVFTVDAKGHVTGVTSTAISVSVTPAALTKTDDTNVTLALTGLPATALLQAVNMQLGWTGTLAPSRGGTGISSYTTGDMLYWNGSSFTKLGIGGAQQTLHVVSGVPAWRDTATVSGITADNGLNMSTSSNVQLGGALLANTTVNGTFTLNLNMSRLVANAADSISFISTNSSSLSSLGNVNLLGSVITAKAATATFTGSTKSIFGYETSTSDTIALEAKATGARWVGITTASGNAAMKPLQQDTVTGFMRRQLIDISNNTAQITGILSVVNGGTGASTLTANNVILGNGTSPVQFVAPGTSGNVLQSNGTTWTSASIASGVTSASNTDSSVRVTPTTGNVVISSWFKRGWINSSANLSTNVVQFITNTDSLFLSSVFIEGAVASNKPAARFVFGGSGVFTSGSNTSITFTGSSGSTTNFKNFNGANVVVINTNATNAPLFTSTDLMTSTSHASVSLTSNAASGVANGQALLINTTGTDAGGYSSTTLENVKGFMVLRGTGTVATANVFNSTINYGQSANNNPTTALSNYYANLNYSGTGTQNITTFRAFYFDSIGYSTSRVTNGYVWYQTGTSLYNFSAGLSKFGYGATGSVTPTSTVQVDGSFAYAYKATAVDYTATAGDCVIEITGATKTVTLPTAVGCAGRIYTVKLTASGTTGTVATTSSQNIDASTTYSLSAQYKYVSMQSNNVGWIIIANN